MASSRQIRSRVSSATAASKAAISSGSGGSGIYSLAPAWIAATAARASLSVPQATIGVAMRSAVSLPARSRMSSATSTIRRSAPRVRSTLSACSVSIAWVTAAPRSTAILVAALSWPFSVPIMRSRMAVPPYRLSVTLRLDDFRHGDAEPVLDEDHLAAGDEPVVHEDVDRFAHLAVEFEHGPGSEFQEIADIHARAAEHRRHVHRHVKHGFEIGRRLQRYRILGRDRRRRFGAGDHLDIAFEIGQRRLVGRVAGRGLVAHFAVSESERLKDFVLVLR